MKRLVLITTLTLSLMLLSGAFLAHGQEQTRPPMPPGASSAQTRQRQDAQERQSGVNMTRMLIRLLDMDNDGKISIREYTKFFTNADQNGDGSISQQDIMEEVSKRHREINRREQEAAGPKVGEDAPDFALRTLDGKRIVKLSDFKGREPVVLVFGSYT